jgi:hypothetical protein
MASHFVSLNRGQEGSRYSGFVTGAASSGNVGIELRLDDAAAYTKKDVINALEAFERFFENAQQVGASGFVVTG